MPRVSVIVPVRNEAAHIRGTLEGLLRQDFDPDELEVIVVDGQSEDATVAVVRSLQNQFKHLHVLMNPRRLSSAARNLGLRHAAGEFTVIIDGHCAVSDSNYLKNLVVAFETSNADTLGRPQPLRAGEQTPFQMAVALGRESWLGHNPDSSIYSDQAKFVHAENVAIAYRRRVYQQVGLFDEQFDACEDVEFNTRVDRAGLTCWFTPTIQVAYHPRTSLRGLFRQMARYGGGRAKLAWKHPLSVTLPSLVPPMWLVWLALIPILGIFSETMLKVGLLSIVGYVAVLMLEALRHCRRVPFKTAMWIPLVIMTVHIGFGWGWLREFGKQLLRR